MPEANRILQEREIEISALMTIRIAETTSVLRFQNWLSESFTHDGITYPRLTFDLQGGTGRGLINRNVPYILSIPEQKRFSVKQTAAQYSGLRNSLIAIAFVFPGQTEADGSDVRAIRQQRFKVRSSELKNSVLYMELDSLTDANFSAIGDIVNFPTFRLQKRTQLNSHFHFYR